MNNSKQVLLSCQHNSYKSPLKPAQSAYNDLFKCILNLGKTSYRTIHYFLKLAKYYPVIRPGQARIAKYVGVCRETINRTCKDLRDLGLINWAKQHRHANRYSFLGVLSDPKVRSAFLATLVAGATQDLHDQYDLIQSNLEIAYNAHQQYVIENVTPIKESEKSSAKSLGRRVALAKERAYGEDPKRVTFLEESSEPIGWAQEPGLSPVRKEKKHQKGEILDKVNIIMLAAQGAAESEFIPNYIESIKGMTLTVWGKIKLMAYPEAAIRYASAKLEPNNKLAQPLAYFVKKCDEYCLTHKLRPDWRFKSDLYRALNAPENPPLMAKAEPRPASSPRAASKPYTTPACDPSQWRHPSELTEKGQAWANRWGHKNPCRDNPPEVQSRITPETSVAEAAKIISEFTGTAINPMDLMPTPKFDREPDITYAPNANMDQLW